MKAFVYEKAGVSRLVRISPSRGRSSDSAVIRCSPAPCAGPTCAPGSTATSGSPRRGSPGHELCGEIVEIGAGLKGFKVGQRISMAPAIGCGTCYPCRRGLHQPLRQPADHRLPVRRRVRRVHGGSGRSRSTSGNVYHTPTDVAGRRGGPCGADCLRGQRPGVPPHRQKGDSVAIFGSGFIGCMHAELARMKGARPDHHDRAEREPGGGRPRAHPVLLPGRLQRDGPARRGEEAHRGPRGRRDRSPPAPWARRRPTRVALCRQARPDQPLRRPGEGDHGLPRQQR